MNWASACHWKDRRVLVTGASGFIGGHVCARLAASGAEVHGAGDTRPPLNATVAHRARLPNDAADLVDAVAPEVVFHLACPIDLGHNEAVLDTLRSGTVDATVALAHAALRHEARMVLVSSCAVYEGSTAPFSETAPLAPHSPYGRLKQEAEIAADVSSKLALSCVRPFRTYGPGCATGLVAEVCRAAVTHTPVSLTDGRQVREWNHVDGIAAGIIAAGVHPAAVGRVINLGGGDRLSVGDLAQRIVKLADAPASILSLGRTPRRPGEIDTFWGDHRRSEHMWGPLPAIPLDTGLRQTLAWHRQGQERRA